MKVAKIVISCILVIGICIGLYRLIIPSEIIGYSAVIESVEKLDGEYRYTVLVENGHTWVLYDQEQYQKNDNLVVIFYTFRSLQCENWEALEMWKCG